MQAQLWTISGLSAELGIDRRTLAKRLADLEPADLDKRTNGAKIRRYKLADVFHHMLAAARPKATPLDPSAPGGIDPETLPPRDRLAWHQGEAQRRKNDLEAGQLYERAPTLELFATAVATFAEQTRAIPDILERRAGLTPRQAEQAADEIDTQLEQLKARLLDQFAHPAS
ncbi:hypothetical protein CKO42_16375 [Lamprobacter modestohalophilus]|uniref:Terminase small subunit n=1 Tax=Lamprobacter modestohalophilus TaxID=1064514 RepID=A0A9X0WAS9_9GAMM|nr:DUF1441 family protein [Lamprobacter modestohalophilus]MBK1619987.1 hypothetical protein [Lamprobacter modestohalophilus]